MIRRTSKYLVVTALAGCAAYGNAAAPAVTPAFAACSRALVETLAGTETLPAYTLKAPSVLVSDLVDPNAFTLVAHSLKTGTLLAKASCKATPAGEIVSFEPIPLKS